VCTWLTNHQQTVRKIKNSGRQILTYVINKLNK